MHCATVQHMGHERKTRKGDGAGFEKVAKVLPVPGGKGATSYDLCVASSFVILSRGKGATEIGLAVSLPLGTYDRIALHSGLFIWSSINIGVGVLILDYLCKTKVVLFNHSTNDFAIQADDQIAYLIVERVETPKVKKVAVLDDTDYVAAGFGVRPLTQPPQRNLKNSKEKESFIPNTRFTTTASATIDQHGVNMGLGVMRHRFYS